MCSSIYSWKKYQNKNGKKSENCWKGLDFLITEIVRKASDHLNRKKQMIGDRAHKEENNNCFLNEVSGKVKTKKRGNFNFTYIYFHECLRNL